MSDPFVKTPLTLSIVISVTPSPATNEWSHCGNRGKSRRSMLQLRVTSTEEAQFKVLLHIIGRMFWTCVWRENRTYKKKKKKKNPRALTLQQRNTHLNLLLQEVKLENLIFYHLTVYKAKGAISCLGPPRSNISVYIPTIGALHSYKLHVWKDGFERMKDRQKKTCWPYISPVPVHVKPPFITVFSLHIWVLRDPVWAVGKHWPLIWKLSWSFIVHTHLYFWSTPTSQTSTPPMVSEPK